MVEDNKTEAVVDTKSGENFNTKEIMGADETIKQVYEWSLKQLAAEIARLNALSVSPIEIQVIDMSVLLQGPKQLNRVVFNTELDFN